MSVEKAFSKAFTEWERRYREEPQKFASDFQRFTESVESYGDACAPFFIQILNELSGGKPWDQIQ